MATTISLLIFLSFPLFLAIQSHAANCTSQSFSKNRIYALCNDLSHLKASLHWTYDASNSSLNLAFVAPPAKSNGWIAWAINPTATGMIGSQALIAFHGSNGSMEVHTYNISSYSAISPSPIAFEVWSTEAERSGGVMMIFASVALPGKSTTVNQVWQVGSSVNGTSPAKHDFSSENLNAKGTLDLMKGESRGGNGTASGGAGGGGGSNSAPDLDSRSFPFSLSVLVFVFFLGFSYRV